MTDFLPKSEDAVTPRPCTSLRLPEMISLESQTIPHGLLNPSVILFPANVTYQRYIVSTWK